MVVRARDLRAAIKEQGFEKGVVSTLEQLLDEYAGHRQNMREMAELLAKCIDNIEAMTHVGSEVVGKIDEMKRLMGEAGDGRSG